MQDHATPLRAVDGDVLHVGGSFPGKLDLTLQADFSAFADAFTRAQALLEKMRPEAEGYQAWLKSANSDADPLLFMALYAFHATLNAAYPDISAHAKGRSTLYSHIKDLKLSDLVRGKHVLCVEFSLLAHGYLNYLKIENRFVLGAAVLTENQDAEAHSFLFLPNAGRLAIFDPANPVRSEQGIFPALYYADNTQARAWEEHATQDFCFMQVTNTLTGTNALYGVADSSACFDIEDYTIQAGGKMPKAMGGDKPTHNASSAKTPAVT